MSKPLIDSYQLIGENKKITLDKKAVKTRNLPSIFPPEVTNIRNQSVGPSSCDEAMRK